MFVSKRRHVNDFCDRIRLCNRSATEFLDWKNVESRSHCNGIEHNIFNNILAWRRYIILGGVHMHEFVVSTHSLLAIRCTAFCMVTRQGVDNIELISLNTMQLPLFYSSPIIDNDIQGISLSINNPNAKVAPQTSSPRKRGKVRGGFRALIPNSKKRRQFREWFFRQWKSLLIIKQVQVHRNIVPTRDRRPRPESRFFNKRHN